MTTPRLHTAMAGSGNPYAVLNEQRHLTLFYLHQGVSLNEIAERLQLDAAILRKELVPLLDAHLITQHEDDYRPSFVVVDGAETKHIEQHVQSIGKSLADYLLARWDDLENNYTKLTISQTQTLKNLAFLLIGDRLLDIELLNVLATEGSLMPAAPSRPSPDNPDAHYYFWMLEGHWDLLGKYGQNSIALPYNAWSLITFGRYEMADSANNARRSFEKQAQAVFEQHTSPQALANSLNIPIFIPADSSMWTGYIRQHAQSLANIYKAHEPSLRELFSSLHTSTYLPDHFGEFFCWYNHLAYAVAIDGLIANGVMALPEHDFVGTLWYEPDMSAFFSS